MPADDQVYRCKEQDGSFAVLDPEGNVTLTVRDRHSAEHYAALLSEAYRRGFRAGRRAGKG